MALANTYSFSVTATDIVREAMLNIGAIGENEIPTATEYNDCTRKLNLIVKQWMGKQDFAPGLKMWTRQRGDLFMSATTGTYQLGPIGDNWAGGVVTATFPGETHRRSQLTVTSSTGASALTVSTTDILKVTLGDFLVVQLDSGDIFSTTAGVINTSTGVITLGNGNVMPSQSSVSAFLWNYSEKGQRPLAIETALLRDSQANDTPLNRMTLEDYEFLPIKTSAQFPADPTAFYYESQIGSGANTPTITGGGVLYLDCGAAQDVTKHLHVVYLRPVMDLVNASDNPEYPQQWYRALCWGLTREICPMFDGEWTKDMENNLTEAMLFAREGDAEVSSLYFEANSDDPV